MYKPRTLEDEDVEEEKKEEEEGDTAIDKANKAAARIEAANKIALEITERNERLHSEQMLGGSSNAGQAPEPKKELTDQEYSAKVLAGENPNESS